MASLTGTAPLSSVTTYKNPPTQPKSQLAMNRSQAVAKMSSAPKQLPVKEIMDNQAKSKPGRVSVMA